MDKYPYEVMEKLDSILKDTDSLAWMFSKTPERNFSRHRKLPFHQLAKVLIGIEGNSSKDFLDKLVKAAPFPIRVIQTDNGTEFTNALLVKKSEYKTLFEQAMTDVGIEYHRIRIATPRHNGKVERQHRIDEMRFYKHMRMYNLPDGRNQLAKYQKLSNNYIMTCLGMKSPNQILEAYQDQGVM